MGEITQNRDEAKALKNLEGSQSNPPHPAAAPPGAFSKPPPANTKPIAPNTYGSPVDKPLFGGGNK